MARIASIAIGIILAASLAFAGQTGCPEHFAGGQAPDFINQKLTAKAREICYTGYAVMHSGVTRTPLYAGEHLTKERLDSAKGLRRSSKFFPDPHLPASERAELKDYARSGYDRGHIAPSGDMPDMQSQQECFSLANMVPQVPKNNRGVWEGIESAVREMSEQRGELYVVTGPVFQGGNLQRIGGAVMVPTQLFKAVYDPKRHEAGAYIVDNSADARPEVITIAELEKIAGISVFPSISPQVKGKIMNLLAPRTYKERRQRGY